MTLGPTDEGHRLAEAPCTAFLFELSWSLSSIAALGRRHGRKVQHEEFCRQNTAQLRFAIIVWLLALLLPKGILWRESRPCPGRIERHRMATHGVSPKRPSSAGTAPHRRPIPVPGASRAGVRIPNIVAVLAPRCSRLCGKSPMPNDASRGSGSGDPSGHEPGTRVPGRATTGHRHARKPHRSGWYGEDRPQSPSVLLYSWFCAGCLSRWQVSHGSVPALWRLFALCVMWSGCRSSMTMVLVAFASSRLVR